MVRFFDLFMAGYALVHLRLVLGAALSRDVTGVFSKYGPRGDDAVAGACYYAKSLMAIALILLQGAGGVAFREAASVSFALYAVVLAGILHALRGPLPRTVHFYLVVAGLLLLEAGADRFRSDEPLAAN